MKKPPVKKGGRFFRNSLSIKRLRFTLLLGLDERPAASAVYADGKRRVKVNEPEPGSLLFGPLEVPGAGYFPADILSEVMGERFGTLHEKACADAFGNGPHALLGALHEDWHLGDFGTDKAAKVHFGIQFFPLLCNAGALEPNRLILKRLRGSLGLNLFPKNSANAYISTT